MFNLSIRRRHWRLLTHWKRPWCWERLKAGEEGDDRGWDGWMTSPTQWTWVWVSSRSWWWTGKPGMLQSMELQTVGHWVTELYWTEYNWSWILPPYQDPKLNLRHSFGWIRKESLYFSARRKGLMPSRLNLNLEWVVRTFIVMVQKGSDWIVDTLLTWCLWGKWELSSGCKHLGLQTCGQNNLLTTNFSHLEVVSVSTVQLKDIVECILMGNQDLAPWLHYYFSWLFLSCFYILTLL